MWNTDSHDRSCALIKKPYTLHGSLFIFISMLQLCEKDLTTQFHATCTVGLTVRRSVTSNMKRRRSATMDATFGGVMIAVIFAVTQCEDPATLSECSIYSDNTTLTGSCRVDKAFSSDGNYSCQWGILYPSTSSAIMMPSVLIVTDYSDSGKQYYQGVCSFSYALPQTNGAYTLFFSMFPCGPNLAEVGQFTMHSETQTSDNGDSFPVGVIGGGVGAAVVVIVVVVVVIIIWKRRAGNQKSGFLITDLEEHHNIAYEPADTPCEVNDAYQPAAGKSTAQKHRVDQAYEDSSLTSQDDEPGYASPDNGRHPAGYTGLASGSGFQAHPEPSMDDGLYTSVDDPTPGSLAAVPESSTHDNEYAVVDKSKKSRKQHSFQPKPAADGELYAQVNKSRPAPGGDVYAQVDKSSKRANSKPTKNNVDDGNYAEVQKPKPDQKPKPTCAVKPSPRNSSDSGKTSGGDDEYNVLTFQGQHSQSSMSPQVEQQYSHIGSV
ncbi:hypothetical protein BaRGS_00011343 [Batillaria attramentaria]|uniref:Uncharacterized protein n=1 Tax=Batillaria attramentaria TaxID=370345 RepID=A0ABD0LDE6_9CAEN